jgi:phosphatidylinositol alpha-mannosyltransferase
MKIAQVCPYDFTRHGGVKTHILQLAEALRGLGHEVKIIAPKTTDLTEDEDVHFFGKNYSVGFGGTKIDINGCFGVERKRLKAFLKNEQFDIIHYHTIWNPILPFQVLSYSTSKNIGTFHDTPGKGFLPQLIGSTLMPVMARIVFRHLQGILSVSSSQARYISRLSKRSITIIPNGINILKKTYPKIAAFNDGKINLLFLGRLEPRKGLMEALLAFKSLSAEYDNLRLLIAGEGDLMASSKQFVNDHDLGEVHFLGAVDETRKWELFASSNIYLAPALYGESFGIVLLEAMTAGVPMAGYANEGYLNVINDEQKRYFTLPGDTKGLTENMRTLITSPEIRDQLVVTGHQVAAPYDWRQLALQIEKVYRE